MKKIGNYKTKDFSYKTTSMKEIKLISIDIYYLCDTNETPGL